MRQIGYQRLCGLNERSIVAVHQFQPRMSYAWRQFLLYHMEPFRFSDTHRRLRAVAAEHDATMPAVSPHID
ncbi:hypothetical protein IE4771_PB00159 (plasmid) [Rhizobium etli bv. mimosae str. IE4771]|uniref:Uncharacterized protein n=1 Tax=Rhizobium etli bv. mimosae str. IE4771 TaxID=1432050 RepID=A0A060ICU8_RHIET|nr:hypothetical protein IE4771_PB00159 [Rhizobium sp. IE4771]